MVFSIYLLLPDLSDIENPEYKAEENQPLHELAPSIKPPILTEAKQKEVPEDLIEPLPPALENPKGDANNKASAINSIKEIEMMEKDLFQPNYDNLIVRSRAKAFIILQDSNGKLLESQTDINVRAWRNIRDKWWLEDKVFFNQTTSEIEFDGYGRQGIEPGNYSIEIDGGGYGHLKLQFDINKDEIFRASYKMPNSKKVILVQFVDQGGNPVEYIRNLPTYHIEKKIIPFAFYASKHKLLLKNPPIINKILDGKDAKIELKPAKRSLEDFVYHVDKGKIYLSVFMGQMGEVMYQFRNNEGSRDPFIFKSDFMEKEIITIPIKETVIINESTKLIQIKESFNNELVGLNASPPMSEEKEVVKLFDFWKRGFIYQLKNTRFPLQLEYQLGIEPIETLKGDDSLFQYNFGAKQKNETVNIRFVDKKILKTPWETVPIDSQKAVQKDVHFDLHDFKVKFNFSPTFFEFAKDFSEIACADSAFSLECDHNSIFFTSFFIKDQTVFKDNLEGLKLSISSKIIYFSIAGRDGKFFRRFFPKGFEDKSEIDAFFQEPLKIDSNEILNNYLHEIEISPVQNTLILRVIDYNTGGIPWVEGSLILFEDREVSLEVKDTISLANNEEFLNKLTDTELKVSADSNIDKAYFKKLKQIFPKKRNLEYFLFNGAWYNAHAISYSDSAGYFVLKSDELIPGKKYSLFLWCQSQDEFKPDKEIFFIAKKGITDLGAIKF